MGPLTCRRLVKRVAVDGRTEALSHEAVYLARTGVSLERRFREEELAIQLHLEAPAATWPQRRLGDPRRPPGEKLSHQTGGSISVVSDDAELDVQVVRPIGWFTLHASTLTRGASPRS